jgi:death-on-curing protein
MAGAEADEVTYLELSDFHQAVVEALGIDVETARRITNDTLAGSALAASAAGFGDFEKYPDFAMKVAVLLQAITSNHALPDGNKRTALLCAIVFAGINGFRWEPPVDDEHDGAETARIVEAAAAGTILLEELRDWISERLVEVSVG